MVDRQTSVERELLVCRAEQRGAGEVGQWPPGYFWILLSTADRTREISSFKHGEEIATRSSNGTGSTARSWTVLSGCLRLQDFGSTGLAAG